MVIESLLTDPQPTAGALEARFRNPDELLEAQLIEARILPSFELTAFLFDVRNSIQPYPGNVALLRGGGVRALSWEETAQLPHSRHAWTVVSVDLESLRSTLRITLALVPDGMLRLEAEWLELLLGNNADLTPAPPDYGMLSESEIDENTPGWHSHMEVKTREYIKPAEPFQT